MLLSITIICNIRRIFIAFDLYRLVHIFEISLDISGAREVRSIFGYCANSWWNPMRVRGTIWLFGVLYATLYNVARYHNGYWYGTSSITTRALKYQSTDAANCTARSRLPALKSRPMDMNYSKDRVIAIHRCRLALPLIAIPHFME